MNIKTKFIFLISSVLVSTALFAGQKINIVNPAGTDGGTIQLLTALAEGSESEVVQAGTPVNALSYHSSSNVLTVWSSEWPAIPNMKNPTISPENTVGIMTYETVMCSREFNSIDAMSGKTIKVSTWGHVHASKFLKKFGDQHNINFVVVPYKGSGSIVMGYAGGDADTVFVAESRRKGVLADGKTKCLVSSAENQIDFRFVDVIITLNADKSLTDTLRKSLSANVAKTNWSEKFSGTRTFIGGNNLNYYYDSVTQMSGIAK